MLYSPREAARLTGVPITSINNWLQRSRDIITAQAGNGRPRFDKRGLRILALMRAQTERGISPNLAAQHAASIADRDTKGWPIAAVFSGEPRHCPALVPEDAFPADGPLLIVPLQPLYRAIDEAIGVV
ncbi:hypothetical protein ASE63_06685 [Bosea sp. Root381]|uniref:MerR family transcriptional regulator n=1 Tax=Bosea sp. Root381 TaxID=1736524 RepID=UPI0006F4D398|nr:MerR family transcriptional regulator [Bosea sp. Root381]KRE05981.1 hypothetical protein ASE63_06685 [Bosea sp. Root381]